jgi:hypothetical protein
VSPGTPPYQAVFATVGALSRAAELPGPVDQEIRLAPTRALVRRVAGHNVWIVYRFDAEHVFIMTVRGEPPVPADE